MYKTYQFTNFVWGRYMLSHTAKTAKIIKGDN